MLILSYQKRNKNPNLQLIRSIWPYRVKCLYNIVLIKLEN